MIKKLVCVIFSLFFVFSFFGCDFIYIDDSKEQKAYNETLDSLFDALDNKDSEAVYNLFSPDIRERDKDLKDQINKLISVYHGPTDEIGWDGLLAGSGSYEYGDRIEDAYTTFPVRSEDTYYWFYLNLTYDNTTDENQIGITQLDFYTADEYCIFNYDDKSTYVDSIGLEVYAEKTLEEEIRCINGWPHKYSSATKPLNIENVKKFFDTSSSFADFKSNFGAQNAENIYKYYELPNVDGKPRYLEIGTDGDTIYNASIVDDFKYIETVFDNSDY